ncbi:hypothetical protein LTR13_009476 [Exophiala sideris]|nr:hypothetical protein LTR13_009476 [Exophiala sideris]
MFSKYSIVDILPPANSLSHLSELCVSPFITGHIDNGTEFVLGFSVFALSSKLELILRQMERLPAMHNIDASLARRFMSIAPVLSALAILDIQRLTQHTSIGAIEVSRIVPHQEPGTITVVGMTVTATMFTWFT